MKDAWQFHMVPEFSGFLGLIVRQIIKPSEFVILLVDQGDLN